MVLLDENGRLFLETGMSLHTQLEAIEKKGCGHPDTLTDDLAEYLSRVYCQRTESECGAVVHHTFDKTVLLGGESAVKYGGGRMTRPIRCLINGRASLNFAGRSLGVEGLLTEATREFFGARLPLLDPEWIEITLNLSTASSPGRVLQESPAEFAHRHNWFSPRSLEDLRETKELLANDTSFGTGYAPISLSERLVVGLSDLLSRYDHPDHPSFLGTDTKIMLFRSGERFDAIVALPMIAGETLSRIAYLDHLAETSRLIHRYARDHFGVELNLLTNHRDRVEEDEIYLTLTGSSIETGDEGVVGRGNRINGLITPFRPMNVEGANGKNPVYHVGKLYNIIANRIAAALHEEFGGAVWVNLASATGNPLLKPWRAHVKTERDASIEVVSRVIDEIFASIPQVTRSVICGDIRLS